MPVERFVRPAVCSANSGSPTKTAHCQLWNPAGSGYKAIIEQIHIQSPSGFNIGGHGADPGVLSGASFSESRGLPFMTDQVRPWPVCHARLANLETVAVLGMWLWSTQKEAVITIPFERRPNAGLIVRAIEANSPLSVTFYWREEPYTE